METALAIKQHIPDINAMRKKDGTGKCLHVRVCLYHKDLEVMQD